MDPVKRLWMYESWIEDMVEKHKFSRNYSILTGSFFNMEMAQKMMNDNRPEYQSTDADFEETLKMIEGDVKKTGRNTRRRRQRHGVVK